MHAGRMEAANSTAIEQEKGHRLLEYQLLEYQLKVTADRHNGQAVKKATRKGECAHESCDREQGWDLH
jgi:hypothetical protein